MVLGEFERVIYAHSIYIPFENSPNRSSVYIRLSKIPCYLDLLEVDLLASGASLEGLF